APTGGALTPGSELPPALPPLTELLRSRPLRTSRQCRHSPITPALTPPWRCPAPQVIQPSPSRRRCADRRSRRLGEHSGLLHGALPQQVVDHAQRDREGGQVPGVA